MEFLTEPSIPIAILEVLIGIFLLARSADAFVEGAANIAGSLRISPVVIGAVLIGFGTSLPELPSPAWPPPMATSISASGTSSGPMWPT